MRGEFAVHILPEVMKIHRFVAFELFFVDLHRMCVDSRLLPLPALNVWVKLQTIEILRVKNPTSQIKFGQLPKRLNLLSQNDNLVFVPGEMRRDLHRVNQCCWSWQ